MRFRLKWPGGRRSEAASDYRAPWPPAPPTADPYREPVQRPRYRSRFGGLWTDLSHARALLEGRAALGLVTAEETALLAGFIERGYVILERAVPEAWLDELERDVETVWREGHPQAWVSAVEEGLGITRPLRPRDDAGSGGMIKLVDVYEYLESARRVVFAPAIQRFLELVFERPPMAHQSLSFYRGSRQPIHQDTAFVRISSPLEMVASWIALEDVQPGSGELEYYEGSHALPEFLFEGRWKWHPPGNQELDAYYAHLHRSAEARGLARTRFRPHRGDVLLWAADLAHGGSDYQDPTRTRRSLVTHYCPVDCHPMYFHYHEHTPRLRWGERSHYCAMKKFRWRSG